MIKVAVDAMTSERGIGTVVAGAYDALKEISDLEIVLVGDEAAVRPLLAGHPKDPRVTLQAASQVIGMDEEPGQAFKAKKDASISVALRLVADGKAGAAVSPGNTGASVIASTLILGRLPGIRRPGIFITIPRRDGNTSILDGGATVDCKPEDLALFGVMGSFFCQEVLKADKPRVGLLSIGEEDIKGSEQSLAAFELLKKTSIHFIGNVEGGDIFNGRCDLVICDGFVGNIVLKTAEGLAGLIFDEIRRSFDAGGPVTKLGGLLSKPAFKHLRSKLNKDEYGGAILLGVAGNTIIAHGSANQIAIKNAIRRAHACCKEQLVTRLSDRIQQVSGVAS